MPNDKQIDSLLQKYRFQRRKHCSIFKSENMPVASYSVLIKDGTTCTMPPKYSQGNSATTSPSSSPWLSKMAAQSGQGNRTQEMKCGKLAKFKRIRAHSSSSSSDSACDSNSYLVLSSSSDVQEIDAHNSDDSIPSEPSVDAADCHRNVPARDQVLLSKCSSRPSWHSPTVSVASNSRHHPVSVKGQPLKRCFDDESSTRSCEAKTYKRIRVTPHSIGSDFTDSTYSSQNGRDSQVAEHSAIGGIVRLSSETEDTSVESLHGVFSTVPKERLRQVLRDCNGEAEFATSILCNGLNGLEAISDINCPSGQPDMNIGPDELTISESGHSSNKGDSHSPINIGRVLAFFEEASHAELMSIPGCSRRKAEAIVTLRPFGSYEQLIQTFDSSPLLNAALVDGCLEVIRLRMEVKRLMQQCERISSRMGSAVSRLNLLSPGSGKSAMERVASQPRLLNSECQLKPYQLIGLNWLKIMHSQGLNGLLADEMGLGKTVQAIALLAYLMEKEDSGPHCIVVPSSTIENWLRELSHWCPALVVVLYYGSQEERRSTQHSLRQHDSTFNVLLTTYQMAVGTSYDRSFFRKFQFHYAVFDEGHMLKNMSSLRFQSLMKIQARRRLLLTGTPLQNNLLELMSLLCFVMPDFFAGKTNSLKKMFSIISRDEAEQGQYEKESIAQAQRIMKPFVLRRLKKDVLVDLPKKEEVVYHCPLLPEQQDLYSAQLSRLCKDVEGESTLGIGVFMQLRKAANHPLLMRSIYDDDKLSQMAQLLAQEPSHRDRGAVPKCIMDDMAMMNDLELCSLCKQYKKYLGKFELDPSLFCKSGKFCRLDLILPTLKLQDDRVLFFSQFTMVLDIAEVYLKQRDMQFIRLDGSTRVTDRQGLIDRFNGDPSIFVFLLSTRAGGLGINLTAANVVVLHDIDFNPYNDKQAEDRCHRLGQTRTVRVIRLISENTVEEGMLSCARAKLRLEQDVAVATATDNSEEAQADIAMLLREAVCRLQQSEHACQTGSSPRSLAPHLPVSMCSLGS